MSRQAHMLAAALNSPIAVDASILVRMINAVESAMSDEENSLRLLTVRETAKILKVKDHRVYELARLRLLPAVRLGRQLRIDEQRLRGGLQMEAAR
jgi:excisionase family DNA binding protein